MAAESLNEKPVKRVLMVGAAGMGMLPLALYLRGAGVEVWATDDAATPRTRNWLLAGGVHWLSGGEPLPQVDAVIVSSAVRAGHPRLAALPQQVPVWRRGEALACWLQGKKLLAVTGSHGKTTTTALLAHRAQALPQEIGYVVGGLLNDDIAPGHFANGDWVIAEVDESDGTMEEFYPAATLLLNFDWDHADRYRNPAEIEAAWWRLAERTSGPVFVPAGITPPAALRQVLGTRLHCWGDGDNEAAAQYVWKTLFPETETVAAAFGGVWRRQTSHGAEVLEDYAHHPAEIVHLRERLKAAGDRVQRMVIFQPHRYSRTLALARDFARALQDFGEVILLPVYGAGEAPARESAGQALASELAAAGVAYAHGQRDARTLARAAAWLDDKIAQGQSAQVICLGAGDVGDLAPALAALRTAAGDPFAAFLNLLTDGLRAGTILRRNEPLHGWTTLRTGGKAALWAEPADEVDMAAMVSWARLLGLPVAVLGRGSNMVVPDEGFPGLVVALTHSSWRTIQQVEENLWWVAAGTPLMELARRMAAAGQSGFEFLEGIPGSLGGALRVNAGAMGGWVYERASRLRVLEPTGKIAEIPAAAVAAGYREVPGLAGRMVLGAFLRPSGQEDCAQIRQRMKEMARQRRRSQPGGPSAGCMFRNPPGESAGRLIDRAGCKGWQEGAVLVSPQHANFMINTGGATTGEVLRLMQRVRDKVRQDFGIVLEPEVFLLGKEWSEVFADPVLP